MWTSCQKEVKYHARLKTKAMHLLQIQRGIYTVTTQRMKKLYTTHPLAMEAIQYKQ